MTHSIDGIMQKTRRYWYEDGFFEIVTGLLQVVVASLLAVEELVPHESLWFPVVAIAWPLLIIGASIPVRRAIEQLKERVTYPRTGYVAYSGTRRGGWASVAVGVLAAAALVFMGGLWPLHLVLMGGLLIGAAEAYMGHRTGGRRWYVLGGLAAAIGVGVSQFTSLNEAWGLAALLAATGGAMLTSGLLVLRGYLRQTTPTQEG